MYLTSVIARPKGQEENSLESQMLQGGLFNWFKLNLCQLVQQQGVVRGGDTIPLHLLDLFLWKISKRQVRFSSLQTLMGEFPNFSAMAGL